MPLSLNSLGSRVQMSHEQRKAIHWEVLHLTRARDLESNYKVQVPFVFPPSIIYVQIRPCKNTPAADARA